MSRVLKTGDITLTIPKHALETFIQGAFTGLEARIIVMGCIAVVGDMDNGDERALHQYLTIICKVMSGMSTEARDNTILAAKQVFDVDLSLISMNSIKKESEDILEKVMKGSKEEEFK